MASRLPHLTRPVYAAEAINNVPAASSEPRGHSTVPTKIQYSTLPRPISNRYDEYMGSFTAAIGQVPPPALALYTVKDQAVASPRHLRVSCTHIALDDSAQRETGLPVAALWQPLADQVPGDAPIPLISRAPYRCSRCSAYVSPHFRFMQGGRKLQCNICGMSQESPDDYIQDRVNRPELFAGTYEFIAPEVYTNRALCDPLFFFCIETSENALQMGLASQVILSVKSLLEYLPARDRARVGIMTFSSSLTFYKASPAGEPIEVVMNDILDPFVPEPVQSLTFAPSEEASGFLDKLAAWNFTSSKQTVSVGCVVECVKDYLLQGVGGRVIVFTSQLGTLGKHPLKNRDDPKIYNTEKEKLLYQPVPEYVSLGQDCTSADICVDLFACGSGYMDAATLAALCTVTGGDFYLYNSFSLPTHGDAMYYQLLRILTRVQGSQAVMRARASNGLSIENYIGKFKRRGPIELEAACVDADKSIVISLKHDERLVSGLLYHLQCAILYTNQFRQRLIRVSNIAFTASSAIGSVYQGGDVDALANCFLKLFASSIYDSPLPTLRENWHGAMIKLLYSHRVAIKETADLSKLIVPEWLKFLPLYASTSMKLAAFSLSGISVDQRLSCIHSLISMPLLQSRLLLYPLVFALHNLEDATHEPGTLHGELVRLPNLLPCTLKSLATEGVYLVANGATICIVLGSEVPQSLFTEFWGLSSAAELQAAPEYWEFQENPLAQRANSILEELKRRNPGAHPVRTLLFSTDSAQKLFLEDSTPSEMEYGEYLLRLHKIVLSKLGTK